MRVESGFKSFPPTRWSLVERAAQTDACGRRDALDSLLRLYLPALRAHLRIARRLSASDADDVLQGFVADKVVEGGIVARADAARGRFRSYLLVALDRYLISQGRRSRAAKRGGARDASRDAAEAEDSVATAEGPTDAFDTAWARQVLGEAKRRMEADCIATGRHDVWAVFSRHFGPSADDDLAGAGIDDASAAPAQYKKRANLLVTAKRTFRRAVRSVIADYVADDREVDEEIRDLKLALARAGA